MIFRAQRLSLAFVEGDVELELISFLVRYGRMIEDLAKIWTTLFPILSSDYTQTFPSPSLISLYEFLHSKLCEIQLPEIDEMWYIHRMDISLSFVKQS